MAYIVTLEECISILLFTVKLIIGNKPISKNPFTLLDCIGWFGRRCNFSLHVKLMPMQLLKQTLNNKLKETSHIDDNCTVLVHSSHLIRLKLVNGNWIKVKFVSNEPKPKETCVRWIRLYGVPNIAKEICCLSSSFHNNLNVTSASMVLLDTISEMLFKKEMQTYYMGVIIPRYLNLCSEPCLASTVYFSLIAHPDYENDIDLHQPNINYFANPRLVCTGDILMMDFQEEQLEMFDQYLPNETSHIYICIIKIVCSKSCPNDACHLAQISETKFIFTGSSQSKKIPCSDSLIDAAGKISVPPHLEDEYMSIRKIIDEQFHATIDLPMKTTNDLDTISESPEENQSMREQVSESLKVPFKHTILAKTEYEPNRRHSHALQLSSKLKIGHIQSLTSLNSCQYGHVLVQGRAADIGLLLHYLKGSLGYCFYPIECWRLKSESSGATEAKVLQAMTRNTALVPAVFILQGVDILVQGAQGEEDVRVTAALSRGLAQLSSRKVLVLATCEGQGTDSNATTAVPGGLWQLFSYQVQIPGSLGVVQREKLARWFLLNRYSDFVEHTNSTKQSTHPNTSEQSHEELVSLLTHRTVGDSFSGIDAALHQACDACATEFEEQNDTDSHPDRDEGTTLSDDQEQPSSITKFGRRKESYTSLGCGDRPLLLPRHLTTALESLSQERKPGGVASVPQVHWRDVGALEAAKRELVNAVLLPLRYPHLVTAGMRRAGVLLYGPPGTGKTLLAKAVASECGLNFLSVKGPELISMYVGQSELNVRQVFQRARTAAPCVIFFDELDALTPNRGVAGDSGGVMDRLVSAVVAELDECSSSGAGGDDDGGAVFVLAATNRPDLLDPALLRPGRFEKMVYLGPCSDHASLLGILRAATAKLPLCPSARLEAVVPHLPPRLTGADLAAVATDAFYTALRRTVAEIEQGSVPSSDARVLVTEADLVSAAADAVPSVSAQQLAQYETYNAAATSTTSAG